MNNNIIIYAAIIASIIISLVAWLCIKYNKNTFLENFFKIIGLISIVVAIVSYINNNERARREAATNIVLNVQDKIGLGTGLFCAQFFSDMSEGEVRKLILLEEMEIDNEHKSTLNACLSGQGGLLKESKNANHLTLTKTGTYYVLNQITHDLNLLETLALAYYSGIVDKDMIDNTFGSVMASKYIQGFIGKLRLHSNKSFLYLEKYIQSKDRSYPPEKQPL